MLVESTMNNLTLTRLALASALTLWVSRFLAFVFSGVAVSGLAFGQITSTIAGGGSPDGVSAQLPLHTAWKLRIDPAGTMYIATAFHIAKVIKDGTYATIAGNGTFGWRVNNADTPEVSTSISLSNTSFCVDATGDVYISDTYNGRIRKVTRDGTIRTIAGSALQGYAGDGGVAANAGLASPSAIEMSSSGELYFVDQGSVRKIDRFGIITTIMKGLFNTDISDSAALAIDSNNTVYVADYSKHRVSKVVNGALVRVAGTESSGFGGDGGMALNAALNSPASIAVDTFGNLYIADTANHRIRKVTSDGRIVTIAGNGRAGASGDSGPATLAMIDSPISLAFDPAGNLLFVEAVSGRIRKISTDGTISSSTVPVESPYRGDGEIATNVSLYRPMNPTFDTEGNLYFIEFSSVRKVTPDGRIRTVAGNGKHGEFSGDGRIATEVSLSDPAYLAVDGAGALYVAERGSQRVRKIAANGIISTVAGGGVQSVVSTPSGVVVTNGDGGLATKAYLDYPSSLVLDKAGNLYIGGSRRIRKVDTAGVISTIAGTGAWGSIGDGGPAVAAQVTSVEGMTVDSKGNIFFVDAMGPKIRKVTTDGTIHTVAGNGTFGSANSGIGGTTGLATAAYLNRVSGSLAIDSVGNLYFTDRDALRKVTPDGFISVVAGTGAWGFHGDGGPPSGARVNEPDGVAIDASGDVYFADTSNNRIRKISHRGGANHSDMWWGGSSENGWGMSIQQRASGTQFNTLYVYDSAGQARWYVMPGGEWSDGFTVYTGPLYQPSGSALNRYDAAKFVPGAAIGSARIHFLGNSIANLQYTIEGVQGSKQLMRMRFGSNNSARDVGGMWWGGASENGWGVSLAQQGDTLFSVWYTYGEDGKTRWFVAPTGNWSNNTYSGLLYATTGSQWLGSNYAPEALRVAQVGVMNIEFANSNAASFTYTFSTGPFAGTNQSRPLVRMSY